MFQTSPNYSWITCASISEGVGQGVGCGSIHSPPSSPSSSAFLIHRMVFVLLITHKPTSTISHTVATIFHHLTLPLCCPNMLAKGTLKGSLCDCTGSFLLSPLSPTPTIDKIPQSLVVNEGQLQPGPWEPPVAPFNECHFLS